MKSLIVINEEVVKIENVYDNGFDGFYIEGNGCEYHVFSDHEAAGEAAANYWRDMAENDPEEFRCMVGDETLIKWALGQYAGPGNEQADSLEGWFELTAGYPFENETVFTDRQNIVLYRSN